MLQLGGTGILLQGGLHPDLQIGYYEKFLRSLKARFPQVHLHCFSAPEFCASRKFPKSACANHSAPDGRRPAIHPPGGGAEILDDEFAPKSPASNAPATIGKKSIASPIPSDCAPPPP